MKKDLKKSGKALVWKKFLTNDDVRTLRNRGYKVKGSGKLYTVKASSLN